MPDQDLSASQNRYRLLQEILRGLGRVLIAFSGGVDSTFLLKAAKDVLGDHVLAVTALSATTPRREREEAAALACLLEAAHLTIATDELDDPEFVKNPLNKCYVCKKRRFGGLLALAREKGFAWVADGTNADDHQDYRPGSQATLELGIKSPLNAAGLTKADIRDLSRQLGLPTWNKPSLACLASRIPYHSPITAAKLQQIDAAEEFVRDLGIAQVRVRHFGTLARIEVEPADIPRLAAEKVRRDLVEHCQGLGFEQVTLDLQGYRMGSLNPDTG